MRAALRGMAGRVIDRAGRHAAAEMVRSIEPRLDALERRLDAIEQRSQQELAADVALLRAEVQALAQERRSPPSADG